MSYSNLGLLTGGPDLKQRLSKALLDVSGTLASVKSGALVQVWMPEHTHDGTIVLSCQGLPFAVAGVGDLLALFRCVSVRYRFSTDVMKPTLMGAIGRVYSTLEPEMSHNVQKYDKQVYLRVSEAQRCRVHSTLMVPIFGCDARDTPLAVFELVQGDRDVTFPAVLSQLTAALQNVNLLTTDMDTVSVAAGLRKWPMHIDALPSVEYSGAGAGRLSPTSDGPRRILSAQRVLEGLEDKEQAASSHIVATEEKQSPSTSRGDEAGSWGTERPSNGTRLQSSHTAAPSAQPTALGVSQQPSSPQFGAMLSAGPSGPSGPTMLPAATGPAGAGRQEAQTFVTASVDNRTDGAANCPAPTAPPLDAANTHQLMSWLAQQSANGNAALGQLRALLEQQQQLNMKPESAAGAAGAQQPTPVAQPQQQPQAQEPMDVQMANAPLSGTLPCNAAGSPTKATLLQPNASFESAAAAAVAAVAMAAADKQNKASRSGSVQRAMTTATDADDGDGEDISSGGEEDESDDERMGGLRNNNRVGGGAGKRLRFEDLQAQFGLGLKEAANNLGICATTLKRACRRHGIKRWPRRQIAKLSKALNQMGYSGAPPPGLVQNAVVASAAASTQAAPKLKPAKKPDTSVLQHATQLLFQQQLGAAAAANGGMFPNLAAGLMLGGQMQGMSQAMHGHGVYAVSQPGQHQQQQPQSIFPGVQFLGHMGSILGSHGGNTSGQGPQVLMQGMGGAMNGGLGAMQMHGMHPLGGMQSAGALGSMQAAALGLHLQNTGALQVAGTGPAGLSMHAPHGMLHPVLAAGGFGMHAALQQQQQLQQQLQAHQQQQQQSAMQQQVQHQQQQIDAVQHQTPQQQLVGGTLHHAGSPESAGWLGHGGASASGMTLQQVLGHVGSVATAMDIRAPAVSCGDAPSPFSGLAMSPGLSGGLSEIPDDFIQNLNSRSSQLGMMKSGNMGGAMELMDLLGDDIAAR